MSGSDTPREEVLVRSCRFGALVVVAVVAGSCASLPAEGPAMPEPTTSSTAPTGTTVAAAPEPPRPAATTTASGRQRELGQLVRRDLLRASPWTVSGAVRTAGDGSGITFTGWVDPAADASSVRVDLDATLEAYRDDPSLEEASRAQAQRLLGSGFEVLTIGAATWLRWEGLHVEGAEPAWVETNPQRAEAFTSQLGFGAHAVRPLWLLDVLDGATASVVEVGSERVGDRPARHLRLTVDLPSALVGLSPTDQIAVLGEVGPGDVLTLEVWVDDAGRLRRFGYERFGDGDLSTAPTAAQVAVVVDIGDGGEAQALTAPAASVPLDEVLGADPSAP